MPLDRTASSNPDPTPADPVHSALVDALADLRQRYHRALIVGETDPEFADVACAKADAALALARGGPPSTPAP